MKSSDYFKGNPSKLISAVTNGVSGPITVNGKAYNGVMPTQTLNDDDVANVVTFVLNNFGNGGGEVTPAQVSAIRKSGPPTAKK